MSSSAHADLLAEKHELLRQRDDYTREHLGEIFGCFSSIGAATRTVDEGLDRLGGMLRSGDQILGDLRAFEANSWAPFQKQLSALQEAVRREKINRKRTINAKVLRMLRSEVSLSVCLRLVSHLKQQSSELGFDGSSLPRVFLQARDVYITDFILRNDPASVPPEEAFRRACLVMREPVLAVLTQYAAVFPDVQPIAALVSRRFAWFFAIVRQTVRSTGDMLTLAAYWNELVVLNQSYAVFSCPFMSFIQGELVERGVVLCTAGLDKSTALFIRSLDRSVAAEGARLKSIPAFVLLANGIIELFKGLVSFCPPQLLLVLRATLDAKLAPVAAALAPHEPMRRVYEAQFRPFLQACFAQIEAKEPAN